jgi:hypothetical protein
VAVGENLLWAEPDLACDFLNGAEVGLLGDLDVALDI